MSIATKSVEAVRAWFDADGWRLEADALRAALSERGADDDLVVELLDEGADRKRRQPAKVEPAQSPAAKPAAELATVVPITPGNVPPQNKEAEENVLGAMLIAPGAIAACTEVLSGGEFYFESHAKIWRAALALDERGDPVDVITLTDQLEKTGELEDVGGRVRLHEIAALVPASANAAHYARIVRETAMLRGLIRAGGEISRLGWDRPGDAADLVDEAQQITFGLGEGASDDRTEHVSVSVKETFARMADRAESGGEYVGVPSGLRDLDELTTGFEAGNLVLLAARPSMGKSALLHTILANVAVRQQLPVCLFTAEMSKSEVVQRLLAREAHVDGRRIRKAKNLDQAEWARLAKAADTLQKAPIYHDDSGQFGLSYVRGISRRMKQRHPALALIAVDYIQLMSGEGENRNAEVSVISRGLKMLARELHVPVLALSQLNRAVEQRADKRPVLSDLRDSGSLEQDADLVMFLYRDEYYHEESDARGIAELNLAKHRNGPTDGLKLAFQKSYASFSDLAGGYA